MKNYLLDFIINAFHAGNKSSAAKTLGMTRGGFHHYLEGRALKDWQIIAIQAAYSDKLSDTEILALIKRSVNERKNKK